jgi:hypothetical protein
MHSGRPETKKTPQDPTPTGGGVPLPLTYSQPISGQRAANNNSKIPRGSCELLWPMVE